MKTTKIKSIINEELKWLLNELFDPNGGSTYYAPGLDPKVVKLFEDVEDFYQSTLKDDYWKKIRNLFPNYNSPDTDDNKKAVDYILSGMKKQYPDQKWGEMEKSMRKKVLDGIT